MLAYFDDVETAMRVLVIEGDPNIVETVRVCLELRWPDAVIVCAGSGREGITITELQRPNIIILGNSLPDINSLEAVRQIRLNSRVPIVVLTGCGREGQDRL